jgi:hypothetical protein
MRRRSVTVTASILYNLVECPQRVALDAFGDATQRGEISAFVRLLWERGTLFEQETVAALKFPFLDLSVCNEVDRERLTLEAMNKGEPLIYSGCIRSGDLLGNPMVAIKHQVTRTQNNAIRRVASVLHGGNCTVCKNIEILGFYRNARNGRGPPNSPRGIELDLAKDTEK